MHNSQAVLDLTDAMDVFVGRMLKAYSNKTLGCQTGKTTCRNAYEDGTTCVVGAGLPVGFILFYETGASHSVTTMIEQGIVIFPEKYIERIKELQLRHDSAATGADEDCEPISKAQSKKRMKDALYHLAVAVRKDYLYEPGAELPTEYKQDVFKIKAKADEH